MRNKTYVRLTCYFNPPRETTLPLVDLARSAKATGVIEGRLLADVRCREAIRVSADHRNGKTIEEELTTSKVVRLEGGYALTEHFLVQVLRIPAPGAKAVLPAAVEKTVIPLARYNNLADRLYKQLAELEAPIVHVQALCRLHEAELSRMRIDLNDPLTHKKVTAFDLNADFGLLLDGLRYYYATDDKDRNQRTNDLWIVGHRIHAAISGAIALEPAFLQDKGYLGLFSRVSTGLSHLFTAMLHIGTFKAEEGECGAS